MDDPAEKIEKKQNQRCRSMGCIIEYHKEIGKIVYERKKEDERQEAPFGVYCGYKECQ